MIIECPTCSAFVDGNVLGEKQYDPYEHDGPSKIVLIECPRCKSALLGRSEMGPTPPEGDYDWTQPIRLWPKPPETHHHSIPLEVRKALSDADRCFETGVHSASVVMAGRAIEAMCKDKIGPCNLDKGLRKMKEQGLIDNKIWTWGEALRKERNIGAHASGVDVSEEDAEDVLDFANAICEYVYVLTKKFDKYMKRKGTKIRPPTKCIDKGFHGDSLHRIANKADSRWSLIKE